MQESELLFENLGKRIEGEVLSSDLYRSLYSSGASLFRIKPQAIVQPKTRQDVVETILFAREHRIPLTPRGGGTSRAGNELGPGILVDFSKYFHKVVELNTAEKWVKVEPGIILADLNKILKKHGLYFPIDPSTKDSATLGGMIANNSSGPHGVKYGTTRAHVKGLQLVLSNGEIIDTGSFNLQDVKKKAGDTLERKIYERLPEILDSYEDYMEKERPYTTKNSCGYYVWDVLSDDSIDLTPLLSGSEGTLGLVTEATLQLSDIPDKVLSGFVYLDDLGKVGEATQKILEEGPSMVEIMERHILDLAREQRPDLAEYFPENTEASLFIEFQEKSDDELQRKFDQVRRRVVEEQKLAVNVIQAKSAEDMNTFSKVRSISGPILNRMKGPKRPIAFIEDAAVHPSRLPEYISGLRKLFDKFDIKAAIYGHAGDGNLHTMAILDLHQQEDVVKMVGLADAVCELVLGLKGTVSGEHADGRLRSYYVKRQYPNLYGAMREIKNLFDPDRIMNPGVIISEKENSLEKNLKYGPDFTISQTNSSFDSEVLQAQIENCSGCGKCRSYCPIASNYLEEWAKSRGKVTILRELISGKLEPSILETAEFKQVIDSCINCKRCLTECPSGVDVPWLAIKAKADVIKARGLDFSTQVLTSTAALCKQGSTFAPVANIATSLAPVRWALDKAIGIEPERKLPAFRRHNLRRVVKGRKTSHLNSRQVVFFLGCFANYNEPDGEGLPVIEVLEHNGVDVILPEFKCCGIARISSGGHEAIMKDIIYNIELLSQYVEQNIPVIFSEPSCALAVKIEYPRIVSSDRARRVAENCYDIHQYLASLHSQGDLKTDFGRMDITVGYHSPCHIKPLGVTAEPVMLMELIPGLDVVKYSDKCCGMSGTYGLKSKNYDLSMKIGKRLFEEIESSEIDMVATSCGACGMQINQGTGYEPVHPVKLLAEAYQKASVLSEAVT